MAINQKKIKFLFLFFLVLGRACLLMNTNIVGNGQIKYVIILLYVKWKKVFSNYSFIQSTLLMLFLSVLGLFLQLYLE